MPVSKTAHCVSPDSYGLPAHKVNAFVALGCVQDRRCHCDTCPVGIATQNECLRKKFAGKPENIVNFLRLLAEEVRETLASLGLRSLAAAIGRTDLLESTDNRFDFSAILASNEAGNSALELETPTPTNEKNYDQREMKPPSNMRTALIVILRFLYCKQVFII